MTWNRDITGVDDAKKGTYRSLNGAAGENIFIGRASKAGFYCFFKVWRDMQYDAVLDYEGTLYRVEVKGSSNSKINVTRGTRSGKQIKKGSSRTRVLSRDDCDFVVGVDSNNGDCYIIPEDVIHIIGRQDLSYKTLSNYKEKWKLLMFSQNQLTKEQTRDGLLGMDQTDLNQLATNIGIVIPADPIKIPGTRSTITGAKDKTVYMIWETIAKQIYRSFQIISRQRWTHICGGLSFWFQGSVILQPLCKSNVLDGKRKDKSGYIRQAGKEAHECYGRCIPTACEDLCVRSTISESSICANIC